MRSLRLRIFLTAAAFTLRLGVATLLLTAAVPPQAIAASQSTTATPQPAAAQPRPAAATPRPAAATPQATAVPPQATAVPPQAAAATPQATATPPQAAATPQLTAAPQPAGASPAGDSACAACHRQQADHFVSTPMAQALRTVAECDILRQHPDLSFQEGPYRSRIVRTGDRSVLTVTSGSETFTAPLLWAFGRGQAGQTYIFEHRGSLYESRLSYYNSLGGLDLTMGAMGSRPQDIEQAAGRKMDSMGARECFGCHSTGGIRQGRLSLESVIPGVGCDSCHGSGQKHVSATRTGDRTAAAMPRLSTQGPEEISELCGQCHRTWSQIALNGPRGVNNVRFQPYRLANSKCYDSADARIRCTSCHDPHAVLETNLARYDAKCTACHSAQTGRKMCSTGKANCAGCHMPKLELPGAHAKFTDHQIRIVKANQPYPN